MKFNKKKSSIKNVKFGKNVTIIEPVNLYGCEIDDNCFIGPFVEIQEKVKIGKNTRIQSHTFICSNVSIGENCFVGHGVCFVNDKFKGSKLQRNKKKFLKTKVGSGVLIGSNSTILPITIHSKAVIGAGSVVTKNCLKKKIYLGNPAKEMKK
tara:strand:- start:228 stop:683 length:456 start_codon:yes stop_codon:yes gene_type:complete